MLLESISDKDDTQNTYLTLERFFRTTFSEYKNITSFRNKNTQVVLKR